MTFVDRLIWQLKTMVLYSGNGVEFPSIRPWAYNKEIHVNYKLYNVHIYVIRQKSCDGPVGTVRHHVISNASHISNILHIFHYLL